MWLVSGLPPGPGPTRPATLRRRCGAALDKGTLVSFLYGYATLIQPPGCVMLMPWYRAARPRRRAIQAFNPRLQPRRRRHLPRPYFKDNVTQFISEVQGRSNCKGISSSSSSTRLAPHRAAVHKLQRCEEIAIYIQRKAKQSAVITSHNDTGIFSQLSSFVLEVLCVQVGCKLPAPRI